MDPVEDEAVAVLMVDVVRGVGGFIKLRGLAVDGEENEGRVVLDRRTLTLDEFFSGVTELPCLC
jgi:hypothetical protein